MGSDTGGSIRIPAAYCGCVGLKPTFGCVSRYGTLPLGSSLDHVGPMTESARDAALVMDAIAGYDARDDSSSLKTGGRIPQGRVFIGWRAGWRTGKTSTGNERIAPEIAEAFADALRRAEAAGARLMPIRVPDPAAVNVIGRVILLAEGIGLDGDHMPTGERILAPMYRP